MEATVNQSVYTMLGAAVKGAAGGQLVTASAAGETKFQELMDKAKSGQPDSMVEEQPKTQKPAAKTKKEAPAQKQEEDPVETAKKAQMVVVGQLEPEVAFELVTLENPETGEDITIAVGDWEPQIWAYQASPEEIAGEPYPVGKDIQTVEVSDPVADAALETAVPSEDNSPTAVPEKAAVEQFDGEVRQTAEKVDSQVRPQAEPQVQEEETGEITAERGEVKPEPVFHDVKAAPIKVSETAQESRTEETPDVERQLDARLSQALAQGETRVELQLTPEHLGSVKVEITRTAEGAVRISLTAQSSGTRSLLERHADGLRAALGGRTQSDVQVEVRRDEESQRQSDNPYEGHNGQARQQQEQRRHGQSQRTEDFLQQLRLGLIPTEDAQE